MGQAKKRGTFEERKQAAIDDNLLTIRLLKEQQDAWWASLTEEEQQIVADNRLKRIQGLAAIAKWTGAASGGYRGDLLNDIKIRKDGTVSLY